MAKTMRTLGFVTAVLALAPAVARAQAPVARIDSVVHAEMTRQRIPGVAVAIVKNGTLMMAKGFGESNVELHTPVTAETMFQSGSVGKQFTSAGVMTLAPSL